MEPAPPPIAWEKVRERLPRTAHELLAEVQHACERSPQDPARGIERALRARLADLTARFEALVEEES